MGKPWWDDHLQNLWNNVRSSKRIYLKFNGCRRERVRLKSRFINDRNIFDRLLRQCERRYRASQRDKLLQRQTDPKVFWDEIRNLGPGQKSENIKGVYSENGNISHDSDIILAKWKSDFQTLFNPDVYVSDDSFLTRIDDLMRDCEAEFQCCGNVDNTYNIQNEDCEHLNNTITLEEVRKAINHSKNGKSTGIDNIPNEILKLPKLLSPLHKLYQYCFENSVVPDCWYRSIIQPIHKRGKDPLNPLSYIGISLMSTVAKIFSTILNNRITNHLDDNGLLCNEQNGFRKLRSCLDHIYTLTSIVRNRKLQKLPTYICFCRLCQGI